MSPSPTILLLPAILARFLLQIRRLASPILSKTTIYFLFDRRMPTHYLRRLRASQMSSSPRFSNFLWNALRSIRLSLLTMKSIGLTSFERPVILLQQMPTLRRSFKFSLILDAPSLAPASKRISMANLHLEISASSTPPMVKLRLKALACFVGMSLQPTANARPSCPWLLFSDCQAASSFASRLLSLSSLRSNGGAVSWFC